MEPARPSHLHPPVAVATSRRGLFKGAAGLALGSLLVRAGLNRAAAQGDPLPSWNDGAARQAILDFVAAATDEGGAGFVPPQERIATFDQDGTLWVEQPIYTQAVFAVDRVKVLAPEHPDWTTTAPFAAILSGDEKAMAAFSEKDWEQIVGVTHAGMTVEDFQQVAADWMATARNAHFDRLYAQLVYEPMLEVMRLLRDNGFRIYIVSGGGQAFIRSYAEEVYGIPPEQVIGTTFETKYGHDDGTPTLTKEPKLQLNNNDAGKPQDINLFVGKRPAIACGNSTGDQQMLEWANAGERAHLALLVYHDDAEREYAYGPAGGLPDTHVGTLTGALMTEAKSDGWAVVSMKNDWNRIFAFDEEGASATPVAGGLIAIDVLLEPDAAMVEKADAVNARLRENYPQGYSLDATHAPHVTLAQRFVRAGDFAAATAAVGKVLDAERPVGWTLQATGYDYAIWAGVAVTVMLIERTPELERLQQEVLDALAPYTVEEGTAAAFVTSPGSPEINADTIAYVKTFVPAASGQNYVPHVTVGVANEKFVKSLKAEPFAALTAEVAGAAIYHLGDFGTAAKRLWTWKPH